MTRMFIDHLRDGNYLPVIRAALEWLHAGERLGRTARVFIKPNLTFPVYRRGVMVSPACVEALIIALKDYTDHIAVGDSDSGGYNRFSMDEVQARTGLKLLEKKYGIRVLNLSREPALEIELPCGNLRSIAFPRILLEETDCLFSAAVPKIHMNTQVSLTVKNLWGCIPEPPTRLRLHPFLGPVLSEIVKRIPRAIGLLDGAYGLNRSGPLLGDPVPLNWLMMADDLYLADAACCRLMQVEPGTVHHLHAGKSLEERVALLESAEFNQDWRPFMAERFYLKRQWTDLPGYWAFHSPVLSYWAYFSPLAGLLHKLLYLFRKPFYDYRHPGRTIS